ncbi:MAG: hypothetical protein LBC68_09925 [Prevotellaceae bacterium]|nr:hypothetical protein [Prevotellaceae bacterium]
MHVARVALFGVASRYVEDKSKYPDLLQSGALLLIRHRQSLCRTGKIIYQCINPRGLLSLA